MDLRRAAGLALLAACCAAPAAATESNCQIPPPDVVYSGLLYSSHRMCEAGISPLLQGVPEGTAQVMRFTFNSGRDRFWRTVIITELADGSGRLEVVGGGYGRRGVRSPWVDIRPVRRRLSPKALAKLAALADTSGTFDHAVGTWDRDPDGEPTLFVHCQTLTMERADAAGVRRASVHIGCNRPDALMPLVDEVIRLADIGMVRRNWSAYQ